MINQDDLKKMTNEELLEMVAKSKGHTGDDFKQFMGTNFSYGVLTGEIVSRGGRSGWYFPTGTQEPPTEVKIEKTQDTVRRVFTVDKKTAEAWSTFTAPVVFKAALLNEALQRFMNDVETGRVVLKLELSTRPERSYDSLKHPMSLYDDTDCNDNDTTIIT